MSKLNKAFEDQYYDPNDDNCIKSWGNEDHISEQEFYSMILDDGADIFEEGECEKSVYDLAAEKRNIYCRWDYGRNPMGYPEQNTILTAKLEYILKKEKTEKVEGLYTSLLKYRELREIFKEYLIDEIMYLKDLDSENMEILGELCEKEK